MRPRHHFGITSTRSRYASLAPLPFLPNGMVPDCVPEVDAFTQASDVREKRHTYSEKRLAVAALTRARKVCHGCAVLDDCREYALRTYQTWGVWGATTADERNAWWRREHVTARDKTGTERVPRDKFKDVPTLPLFSVEQLRAPREERPKPPPTLAHGKCPNCTRDVVGLVRAGEHLVWKLHYYRTWGNTMRQCIASGVAACVAPEPKGHTHGARAVECAHGPVGDDSTTDGGAAA